MDGTGAYPISDVSKQHALDVYNAPAFREVRGETHEPNWRLAVWAVHIFLSAQALQLQLSMKDHSQIGTSAPGGYSTPTRRLRSRSE
jgi:hypothetical protein